MITAQGWVGGLDHQGVVMSECHGDDGVVVVVHQSCHSSCCVGHIKERLLLLLCCCQELCECFVLLMNWNSCIRDLVLSFDKIICIERPIRTVTKYAIDGSWTCGHFGHLRRGSQAHGCHGWRVLFNRLFEFLVNGQLELELVAVQRGDKLVTSRQDLGLQG